VDDDGCGYIYFGGGPGKSYAEPGTGRCAKLGADMISIDGEAVTMDIPYLFEDSGINKIGDTYYYSYCTNWNVDAKGTATYGFHNAEIVSMVSDSPMGPFEFNEVILENPGKYCGLYGNNHHCVFTFKDRWYITYHARTLEKSMGIDKGYRITHVDEFTMQEDGTIGIIKQTTTGREQLCYVDPYAENSAAMIAVQGGVQTTAADVNATFYGAGAMALANMDEGAFVKVRGVDFGDTSPKSITAMLKVAGGGEGAIQIRVDSLDGEIVGYVNVDRLTGVEYEAYTSELNTKITGVHDLYFIFCGDGYRVMSWQFGK
jgi:arabinoxylan arabinofuranohydrolase